MKTPQLYSIRSRSRSANGVRDEAKGSKWADFAPLITFATVACFTASLTYVAGLSAGINQNLLGFFDLSDFLRITPAWAVPALGLTLFLNLRSHFADAYRVKEQKLGASEAKTKRDKFFFFLRDISPELIGIVIGLGPIVGYALSLFVRHNKWFLQDLPQAVLYIYLTVRLVGGFVDRFRRTHPNDTFIYGLVPVNLAVHLATTLVIAFLFGLWGEPKYIEKNPMARIALKDEKTIVEGKVFLELNRFILFLAPGNKLTAVAAGDVNWMEFPKPGSTQHKENPKAETTKTAASVK